MIYDVIRKSDGIKYVVQAGDGIKYVVQAV